MKMKPLVAFLLALVILMTPVLGLEEATAAGTGKITVTNAKEGKNYSIYKVFDLTQSGTNVSYTIAAEWEGFFTTGAGKDYIVAENNAEGSLNAIVVDGEVKYINITEGNIVEFAKAAQGQIGTIAKTDTQSEANGSVVFEGLALGYYLVSPEGATEPTEVNGSIVSLTSTVPTAEIASKGEYPTVEKEATKVTADIGGTVSYKVTTKVPDTTGYSTYKFDVVDTMSKGLTFVDGSVVVKVNGTQITENFTVTSAVQADNTTLLTIAFDMLKFQDKVGKAVVITYDATINKDAVVGNGGNPNSVLIEYSNDPKDTTTTDKTPPDEEKVYTGKVTINKHEKGDDTKKLEGAKFVVKNAEGKFYKYVKRTDTAVSWVDTEAEATVLTTDGSGAATFEGLAAGTYYLKEIEAPAGYNLLTEEIAFTLSADKDDQGVVVGMEATSNVENSSGVELPSTGGAGTIAFGLLGGAIMAFAVISLIRGKVRAEGRK
ncbi:MAG: SpaH/EbpB family LPXTG-anchored major pilin [Tissierellia bacterium]|nr:SpaH/EbpB family LPXTG-anchored major pilin [Tissierellia bacterium]